MGMQKRQVQKGLMREGRSQKVHQVLKVKEKLSRLSVGWDKKDLSGDTQYKDTERGRKYLRISGS